MAVSPVWKVYRDGEYVASFKHVDDAVSFAEQCGDGTKVSYNHKRPCWVVGLDSAANRRAVIARIYSRTGRAD